MRLEVPSLPWETGPFAAVFGGPTWLDDLHRKVCSSVMPGVDTSDVLEPVLPKPAPPKPQIITASLAARLSRFRPEPSDDDVRDLALKRLKALITCDPFASELEKSLLGKVGELAPDEVVAQSFADAFRSKAAATLSAHSCALAKFSSWCARRSVEPLCVSEEELYEYLCEMRSSKRGATSGNKFLQSLSFLEHAVGLLFLRTDEVVSARVRGVARDMALTKAPLRQRPALTVEQVQALEVLMCDDLFDADACVLGQLLMCRDIQGLHEVEFSEGTSTSLLIASGLKSKTTQTAEAQRRFLPYVAVATGVSGRHWGKRWLEARESEGLSWGGDFCLPSFSLRLGRWSSARMGSGEATAYLRDFLVAVGLPCDLAGTHSLKTTLLTWASRSISVSFTENERLHLGHHAAPDTKSMLVYSREAYSKLYAKVVAMFRTISEGGFNPDLPPAQRIEHMAASLLRDEVRPSFPSSAGHLDAELSASSGDAQARQEVARAPFPEHMVSDIRVHSYSGISHVMKDDRRLWCNRPVNANYLPFAEAGVAALHPTPCHQCSRALELFNLET